MVDTSIGFGSSSFQSQSTWKGWLAFAFGGITTFSLVYLGIARPAAEELTLLRAQIRSLEKSVALVAGQRDAVDETNHLLNQLSQQQLQANAARKTLVELRELTSQLLVESARVEEATAAIRQLVAIKDVLIDNTDGLERAADALAASEELQERLTNSAEANEMALHASLDLLAIRGELLQDTNRNDQARMALSELLQLKATLNREGSDSELAQNRVVDLIALKNSVLSQTEDLGESIETLELTDELSERFRVAASSFKEIRDWMVEMAAMESTFSYVRQILEPIADLVNLKRMDPNQIRDFTRSFVEQSQNRLSNEPASIVSLRATSDEFSDSTESSEETPID